MCRCAPFWRVCFVFLGIVLFSGQAGAWVETAVRSHEARVEVASDGSALVRHELVLKVRGGPMKSLEIGGMGTSIEPLPDASVRRAVEGSASLWPLSVSSLEDGSVRLKIGAERGIRGGSYLFSFAYSMDFSELKWLEREEHGIVVTWVGPRLTTGVDSARVTFVVPRGALEPTLFEDEKDQGASVLLGEIRRGAKQDEIELVRAHLAVGEPAIWRVKVGPGLFPNAPSLKEADVVSPTLSKGTESREGRNWAKKHRSEFLFVALVSVLYGALVFFKAQFVRAAARVAESREKPLVPFSPWLRALACFGLVGGAVYLALNHRPWPAVFLGVVSACFSTYLLPSRIVKPRGPGVWEEVDPAEKTKRRELPGGLFETRTLKGFALFSLLTLSALTVAYRLLPISNYLALMMTVLCVLLVPIFWTGRSSDLPRTPVLQARPWLKYLARAIDPRVAQVQFWGRRAATAQGQTEYDETRIRLVLANMPAGLRALEVSLEEAAGSCVLPCVVIRVREDSPAMLGLPTDIPWQRGRSPEERVALLRPSAPTRGQLLRLLKSIVGNLRGVQASSSRSVRNATGSAELAANLPTPSAAPSM